MPRDQYRVGKVQATMAESHPAELWFDGARVPADHVVGEVGRGFHAAMSFLNGGRAGFAAQSLGLAELCLDQAVAHAQTRTAFGKPLAANQGVSFPLAECKAEIEAMRWMTYHLAWAIDQDLAAGALMLDSSIAKFYAPSGRTPWPTAACRSSAAWACSGRARSSGCCGTCGCCGSSRAPPRCRSW